MLLGLTGIIISLILLIFLAYRGISVIIAAPVAAMVALIFSGAPLLASYTELFMPALGGFIANYFPMFLTGAIFGGLMSAAGYAKSIAETIVKWFGPRRAVLATVLTSAVLTYGGISVFVVVFVMFPLALELFRAADIPKRLMPATIGLGILTFTMTALPGTPQVQNIIPGTAFGTDTFAAPGLGLVAAVIIFGLGMLWLEFRRRRMAHAGEGFRGITVAESKAGQLQFTRTRSSASIGSSSLDSNLDEPTPMQHASDAAELAPRNKIVPFVPLALVFVVNFSCSLLIFPAMNWESLDQEQFGGVTLADRSAIWAVLLAVLAAITSILLLNHQHLRKLWKILVESTTNSLMPIFSTASEVGYGAVIASVGAFAVIRDGILGASGNALVASAISTSTISGITGSASGGMQIALNALGDDLRAMAIDQGIAMEAMHRITALASGGLDTLPHNGAIITLLLVCGMTHRESYKDIAVISIVTPVLALLVLIPVVMMVGSF